eukprot:3567700-Karenia_brevis.AAC.1
MPLSIRKTWVFGTKITAMCRRRGWPAATYVHHVRKRYVPQMSLLGMPRDTLVQRDSGATQDDKTRTR